MNNKKCPNCGFINFIYAEACRKCETTLSEASTQSVYDFPPSYCGGVNAQRQPYPTKSSFSLLKVLGGAGIAVIVLAIVGAWGVGALSRYRKVQWIEYRPDGMDFTVMMPNKPTRLEPVRTPLTLGNMSNHRYVSNVIGQGSVMFCFVDYTGTTLDMSKASEGLDAELDTFLEDSKATLISKNSITYQGMPGLEFEVSPPGNNTSARASRSYGKMFITYNRLYFLSITAAEGTDLLAGKDQFLTPKLPFRANTFDFSKFKTPDLSNHPVYQPDPDDLR